MSRVLVRKSQRPLSTMRLISQPVREKSPTTAPASSATSPIKSGTSKRVEPARDPAGALKRISQAVQLACHPTRGSIRKIPTRPANNAGLRQIMQPHVQVAKTVTPPKPFEPDVSAAHRLRAAFGLGVREDQVEGTRKSVVADTRAAAKRAKDAASVVHNPPSTGDRSGADGGIYALVFWAVHREWVAAGRRPVTLSAAELAVEFGITVEQVNAVVDRLWRTGQLQSYPTRGGGPTRWAPTL